MKKLFWQIPLLFSLFLCFGLIFGAHQSYACSTGNDCQYYQYCDGGVWPFNNGTCRNFDVTAHAGNAGACDNSPYSNLGGGWFSNAALGWWNGYGSWVWLADGNGQACPEGVTFGKHTLGASYCLHTGNCTQSEYGGNASGYSGSPICEVYDTSSSCGYYPWGDYNTTCSGAQRCTNYQACAGGPYDGPCPGQMSSCTCLCPIHTQCVDAARTVTGFWTYSGYNSPCTTQWCQPYCSTGGPVNCGAWNISEPTNTCGTVYTNRTCQHNTSPYGACVITSKSNYLDYGYPQYDYCSGNYTCPNINNGPQDCVTHIYAQVYYDYNHDGSKNGNDGGLGSVRVTDNAGNTTTTNGSGLATFSGETTGNYNISITVPAGYAAVGATSKGVSLTNGSGNVTVTFYVTPLYEISGNIFNDKDKDTQYDHIDTLYTGTTTIHLSGGPTTISDLTQSDGTYDTGQVLESGTYTVSQTHALNGGYNYTTASTWAVTLGNPNGQIVCDPGSSPDAGCNNPNNGSITGLNFGVSNENPWQQSVCYDVRNDSGTYTDQIPAAPACGGVSGAYNSITNGDCTTGAGIIFTCDATPDFGLGSANTNNWQAGGAGTQQECFTGAGLDIVRTSYDYLLTTARESGITPTDLSTQCTLTNCNLSNIPKGVYIAHGDLTLNSYTFPVDPAVPQGFVFLIDGNLLIKGNIIVPAGSVAAFSTSGNIEVDKSVGNIVTDPNDPAVNNPNLEGLYSADGSFTIDSYGTPSLNNYCGLDGTPRDKKLNIIGSIITNAAQKGGSFVNNRDLCIYDLDCSSVSFGDGNPDGSGSNDEGLALSYILTLFGDGKFLNHKLFNWEELKP